MALPRTTPGHNALHSGPFAARVRALVQRELARFRLATPVETPTTPPVQQEVTWNDVTGKPNFAPADAEENVQANWDEDDTTSDAYIENKPDLAPSDAEANVQPDWGEKDDTSDAFILNKPDLAPVNAEQNVQADWEEKDDTSDAFVRNKPALAPANAEQNVNADWDADSGDEQILNKPGLATETEDGLMSSQDKQRIGGVEQNAAVGRLVARSTALPTAAVTRLVDLSSPHPGEGNPFSYSWNNRAAGYGAFNNAPSNVNNRQRLFPPANPPNLQTTGLFLRAKVGTAFISNASLGWGGSPLTEEGAGFTDDYGTAVLFFAGGRFSEAQGDPGSTTPARVIVRWVTTSVGYGEIALFGDGTALPANSTIEVYEIGVFGVTTDVQAADVNLTVRRRETSILIENSGGTDAVIPEVTNTQAGLQSAADKVRLANVEAGAEVNVAPTWDSVTGKPNFAPVNAEQNVQSDWNATEGDALILNKPPDRVRQTNVDLNTKTPTVQGNDEFYGLSVAEARADFILFRQHLRRPVGEIYVGVPIATMSADDLGGRWVRNADRSKDLTLYHSTNFASGRFTVPAGRTMFCLVAPNGIFTLNFPNWNILSGRPGWLITQDLWNQRWPAWGEVTGKPGTFPPTGHTQAWNTITGTPDFTTRWPTWAEVTEKPFETLVVTPTISITNLTVAQARARFISVQPHTAPLLAGFAFLGLRPGSPAGYQVVRNNDDNPVRLYAIGAPGSAPRLSVPTGGTVAVITTVAGVFSLGLAGLGSPTFTGTPQGPTPVRPTS